MQRHCGCHTQSYLRVFNHAVHASFGRTRNSNDIERHGCALKVLARESREGTTYGTRRSFANANVESEYREKRQGAEQSPRLHDKTVLEPKLMALLVMTAPRPALSRGTQTPR